MSWSINIVKIKGIQLRIHVTFVLILLWGAYYWGAVADDGARGAIFGVIAITLLFVCVTLHELGHALQARAYDIDVEDITLYPIGGIARLAGIPDNPMREFRISIAGPLVNVVIVGFLAVVGWIVGEPAFLYPADLFEEMRNPRWLLLIPYLTFANLALAIFNILPAFPMDGGRILRSLLAMRIDYGRATQIAVAIGQTMALFFGLFGFATGNIFLILIAVFVWMGAGQEGQQTSLRQTLGSTPVRAAMIRRPAALSPNDPLQRAVELTLTTAQSDFPAIDENGTVVGLMTLGDMLGALSENPAARISEVMRQDFAVARPNERIVDVQDRLAQSGARAVPVVDQMGRLVGLLTLTDILEVIRVLSARPSPSGTDEAILLPTAPQLGDPRTASQASADR